MGHWLPLGQSLISMALLQPLPRSIFWRLTLLSALIGLLATAMLYGATRWVVMNHSNATLTRIVDTDLAGLVDIYASGGLPELDKRLRDRIAFSVKGEDPAHYLLADREGKVLAGDISKWPAISAENSQGTFTRLFAGQPVYARATLLDPTHKLLVAREYGGRDSLIHRIGTAFVLAGTLVVLLIALAGQLASLRLRRRVMAINTALYQSQSDDDVSQAPVTNGDELDILSGHVNRVLSRQAALIISHRDISDQTAHELRTPLMHLDMRLLKAIERALDPALLETLARARQEIKKIIRMLESLLDIAANEAQRGDFKRLQPANISELAESLADLFSDSALDRGLILETAIAPDVSMKCDAMQITRMISNLLDNALKYVPSGGTVRLSIAVGPVISVTDNGPGIPVEIRGTVFERFQRPGGQSSNGHGLGLALVRAIAERHGLSITCHDANPGAAFVIKPEGS